MFQGIVIYRPFLFRLLPNPPLAMALFPFILIREEGYAGDKVLLNHERIHLQQELELLIIPFYILYLANYFVNLFIYKSHFKAYKNICFEKEAYQNDSNLSYLKERSFWAWQKYVG